MHPTSVSESSGQYLVQQAMVRSPSIPGSTIIPDAIALPLLVLLMALLLRSSRNLGNAFCRNLRYAYLSYRADQRARQIHTLERIFNRDSASY